MEHVQAHDQGKEDSHSVNGSSVFDSLDFLLKGSLCLTSDACVMVLFDALPARAI